MKKLSLQLDSSIKSIYLRIANGIRAAISNGQLKPQETLPSARKLADELQVNRHTVMAAYQELIAQGWLESVERRGYRVVTFLPVESSIKKAATSKIEQRFKWPINRHISHSPVSNPASEYPLSFVGGMPDLELFPFKEFKSYLDQSLLRSHLKDFGYGNNQATDKFKQQITTYLRRVRAVTHKEVIAVNGSQEALYLIAQVLLKAGDKVAVESLGYRPAWKAFETTGAQLVGIKQHKNGIDVSHLKTLIKKEKIKLIYLTPLHQYPTTITLPVNERMEIYSLAVKHNIVIVEDDYDHEFHYKSQPLAPMAADDPYGLVIYLSSFSKIMFPGCRIGCIAVDRSLVPALVNYRTIINHKTNPLMQDAIALWMEDGAFERHLRRMTKIYQQRRDHLNELLSNYKQQGFELNYHLPAGGMAIWLDIKRKANQLEIHCLRNGLYLQTEQQFHLDKNNNQNRFVRLGFAGMETNKMEQGLEIIFDFLC